MIGKKVPDLKLSFTGSGEINLKDLKAKKLVLYFYPKDNTSGCTLEAQDFTKLSSEFKKQKALILGVSRDSLKSHEKFREKQCISFDLIVDDEEKLCKYFDVMQMKSMYGKKFLGVERSTFIIGSDGVITHEWRKVKVKGHAEEVLEVLKEK